MLSSMFEINRIQEPNGFSRWSVSDYTDGREKVGMRYAMEVLGRHQFLASLARSCFHYTSRANSADGRSIGFDSYKFFES